MGVKPWLMAVWLLFAATQAGAQAETPELSFGVVPQQSASKLAELWGPLISEISQRAGVRLVFRTAPTIPAFEDRLGKGEYDLAYMNPYHYVVFNTATGYRAFARERDRKIKGIIVVRKDSPYAKVSDLAGKTVAFPAPAAFAASILTQSEFGRLGVPIKSKFVASHDSVYRVVASGMQEAGGGIQRTFESTPPDVRGQLRVLTETPAYTPHAFAAHPRVDPTVLARIQAAMVALYNADNGRKLLEPLAMGKGFMVAVDADWNDIRALDLHQLEQYGKQ